MVTFDELVPQEREFRFLERGCLNWAIEDEKNRNFEGGYEQLIQGVEKRVLDFLRWSSDECECFRLSRDGADKLQAILDDQREAGGERDLDGWQLMLILLFIFAKTCSYLLTIRPIIARGLPTRGSQLTTGLDWFNMAPFWYMITRSHTSSASGVLLSGYISN